MQITVLVEQMNGKGYRASCGEPLGLSAEAETRDEVLKQLKAKLDARLSNGAEVVQMDVGASEHPWLKYAGMFKDDPLFDDWQKAIADYRDQVEKDDDYL